jgi:membrane-bound inhibitor of C-type lysozyme
MIRVAGVALALCPGMALAADFTSARYTCDRGVMVPATYVTTPDGSLAVIHVDGNQITLIGEPAASGARYGWPSDGANYVWWAKGPEATLYWKEGGAETALLTCTALP